MINKIQNGDLNVEENKFNKRKKGFRKYWKLVMEVASNSGVKVEERYKRFKQKKRRVTFLDTSDFRIRKTGYILRQRQGYKKGRWCKKVEYALKFRSTVLAVASRAKTKAPEFDAETEFEEDVSFFPSLPLKIKRIYALRTKFKTKEEPHYTVKGFAGFFPVLGKLGIPGDTTLSPVNGIVIYERKIKPGQLRFGHGLKAKAAMTVWLDAKKQPLIAEFSFDHSIKTFGNEPKKATKKMWDFYKALRQRSKNWIAKGTTKTAFTYGRKKK